MDSAELKRLIAHWQAASRRLNTLKEKRSALEPGPAAIALEGDIRVAEAEVEALERKILYGG